MHTHQCDVCFDTWSHDTTGDPIEPPEECAAVFARTCPEHEAGGRDDAEPWYVRRRGLGAP